MSIGEAAEPLGFGNRVDIFMNERLEPEENAFKKLNVLINSMIVPNFIVDAIFGYMVYSLALFNFYQMYQFTHITLLYNIKLASSVPSHPSYVYFYFVLEVPPGFRYIVP